MDLHLLLSPAHLFNVLAAQQTTFSETLERTELDFGLSIEVRPRFSALLAKVLWASTVQSQTGSFFATNSQPSYTHQHTNMSSPSGSTTPNSGPYSSSTPANTVPGPSFPAGRRKTVPKKTTPLKSKGTSPFTPAMQDRQARNKDPYSSSDDLDEGSWSNPSRRAVGWVLSRFQSQTSRHSRECHVRYGSSAPRRGVQKRHTLYSLLIVVWFANLITDVVQKVQRYLWTSR